MVATTIYAIVIASTAIIVTVTTAVFTLLYHSSYPYCLHSIVLVVVIVIQQK